MNNEILQRMVENLSEEKFGRTFQHRAYFNKRLRTTGGRYLLKSHDIEINPKQYEHYGEDAVVKLYCMNCVIITCILLVKVINIKIKILND